MTFAPLARIFVFYAKVKFNDRHFVSPLSHVWTMDVIFRAQRVRIRTFSPTFKAHLKRGQKVSILQLHKRGFVTVTESLIADKPTKVIVVIHMM